jgi:hypothetical protein
VTDAPTDLRELAEWLLERYFNAQTKLIAEYSSSIRPDTVAFHAECVEIAERVGIAPPALDPYYTEDWDS